MADGEIKVVFTADDAAIQAKIARLNAAIAVSNDRIAASAARTTATIESSIARSLAAEDRMHTVASSNAARLAAIRDEAAARMMGAEEKIAATRDEVAARQLAAEEKLEATRDEAASKQLAADERLATIRDEMAGRQLAAEEKLYAVRDEMAAKILAAEERLGAAREEAASRALVAEERLSAAQEERAARSLKAEDSLYATAAMNAARLAATREEAAARILAAEDKLNSQIRANAAKAAAEEEKLAALRERLASKRAKASEAYLPLVRRGGGGMGRYAGEDVIDVETSPLPPFVGGGGRGGRGGGGGRAGGGFWDFFKGKNFSGLSVSGIPYISTLARAITTPFGMATAAVGLSLMALRKAIHAATETAERMAKLSASSFLAGRPLGLMTRASAIGQAFGVSAQEAMTLMWAVNGLNERFAKTSATLTKMAGTLTSYEIKTTAAGGAFRALTAVIFKDVLKSVGDIAESFRRMWEVMQRSYVFTHLLSKALGAVAWVMEKIIQLANIQVSAFLTLINVLGDFTAFLLDRAAAILSFGLTDRLGITGNVPAASPETLQMLDSLGRQIGALFGSNENIRVPQVGGSERVPASAWEKMGLAIGSGVNYPAQTANHTRTTAQNTATTNTLMSQLISAIQSAPRYGSNLA